MNHDKEIYNSNKKKLPLVPSLDNTIYVYTHTFETINDTR